MGRCWDPSSLFEEFGSIETHRLILRPVRPSDAKPTLTILQDPEVIRYFGMPPITTLEEAAARCQRLQAGFDARTKFRLALECKETGEFLGTGGFWRFAPEHFRAEIGYELSRNHWGRGLMAEALDAILQRGFAHGLHSVEANIHPDNRSSRRVLEKLGFRGEGVTRESFYEPHLDVFTDNAIYGLIQADFRREREERLRIRFPK